MFLGACRRRRRRGGLQLYQFRAAWGATGQLSGIWLGLLVGASGGAAQGASILIFLLSLLRVPSEPVCLLAVKDCNVCVWRQGKYQSEWLDPSSQKHGPHLLRVCVCTLCIGCYSRNATLVNNVPCPDARPGTTRLRVSICQTADFRGGKKTLNVTCRFLMLGMRWKALERAMNLS